MRIRARIGENKVNMTSRRLLQPHKFASLRRCICSVRHAEFCLRRILPARQALLRLVSSQSDDAAKNATGVCWCASRSAASADPPWLRCASQRAAIGGITTPMCARKRVRARACCVCVCARARMCCCCCCNAPAVTHLLQPFRARRAQPRADGRVGLRRRAAAAGARRLDLRAPGRARAALQAEEAQRSARAGEQRIAGGGMHACI